MVLLYIEDTWRWKSTIQQKALGVGHTDSENDREDEISIEIESEKLQNHEESNYDRIETKIQSEKMEI